VGIEHNVFAGPDFIRGEREEDAARPTQPRSAETTSLSVVAMISCARSSIALMFRQDSSAGLSAASIKPR
jgi:hypothetical protein